MGSPPVPSRAAIIAACDKNGPLANSVAFSSEIWIKYGIGATEAEAILQQFVRQHADPSILYTPAVYDYFTIPQPNSLPITYIVMERVDGANPANYMKQHPDESDVVLDKIATAVRHLWTLPLPEQALIGPLQGQRAHDWFFSDHGADRVFESVDDLEGWINDKLEDAGKTERVDLKAFPCFICHCDLSQHNILFGDRVILLDWGMSGIYPSIFDEFAMVRQFTCIGAKFVKQLHKKLFGDKFPAILRPLMKISNMNAFGSC